MAKLSRRQKLEKFNKARCPIYNCNELHTQIACEWGGIKKYEILPELVDVHCDGLMHSWYDITGAPHACTCQLANQNSFVFSQYEADNKLISVGG